MSEPFIWPVRVYYEDTDAIGIVYYANYLRFMERARTEWLRHLGFEQDRLREEHGVIFAVTHASVDYRKPALFNDLLSVSVKPGRMRRASVEWHQCVRSARTGDQVLAQGVVRAACLDVATLKPRALPAHLLEALSA